MLEKDRSAMAAVAAAAVDGCKPVASVRPRLHELAVSHRRAPETVGFVILMATRMPSAEACFCVCRDDIVLQACSSSQHTRCLARPPRRISCHQPYDVIH